MANNTGLDEADVEARRPSNPSLPKRNRSLVTPPVKFRILKIHAAETRRGKRPPRWEAPDFPRQRPAHCPLTRGNVGGPHTAGNDGAETALVGWGARIRTWEWRNPNPLPYHLPTRQSARHRKPVPISCQAERATPLEGATHNARIRPGRAGDRAAGRSGRDPAVCSGQRKTPTSFRRPGS